MTITALLGTVLWASYTEASTALQPYISHPVSNAAISGAVAGGSQALVSAPVENVRFLVQGTSGSSWSHAWKEVFRGTTGVRSASRHETVEEARKVRSWMREVGGMAGRGWDGLAYTFGKDVMGAFSHPHSSFDSEDFPRFCGLLHNFRNHSADCAENSSSHYRCHKII